MRASQVLSKNRLASHDKELIKFIIPLVFGFLIVPDWIVSLVSGNTVFRFICGLNPFVTRMVDASNQYEFALFCYGLSFISSPYLLYIVLKSTTLKDGIKARYFSGGRGALRNSAIFSAVFFIFMFFYFDDFSSEHTNRIHRFIFHSHFGSAVMSVGFTVLLVLLMVSFMFYATEYFKRKKL
jgi:hypothetical protein